MTEQKRKIETFFTITTPRKDGSILEQFLDEFGYSAFEKEDRSEDTRRSVKQISSNEELIAEVGDFCRENKCKMQLIYKRGNQLVQQTFQSNKTYSPKTYGESEGQDLQELPPQIETQNVEQKIEDNSIDIFLTGKEKELNDRKPQHKKPQHRRKPQHKKPQHARKPQKSKTPEAKNPPMTDREKANAKANANNPNHPSHPDHPKNKDNAKAKNSKPSKPRKARPQRKSPIQKREPELKQVSESPVARKPQDVSEVTVTRKKRRTLTSP